MTTIDPIAQLYDGVLDYIAFVHMQTGVSPTWSITSGAMAGPWGIVTIGPERFQANAETVRRVHEILLQDVKKWVEQQK